MHPILVLMVTASMVCLPALSAPITEQVDVTGGRIEGIAAATGLRVYLGIPYAAPPVNALRWAPTAPLKPWEGIRTTKKAGAPCMQVSALNPFYATRRDTMSEDCLFLNVWTRARQTDDKLPVMVWIHGGAFVEGAGDLYDGSSLTEKGVIVVTINYRLGPFGFYAHPELTAENLGLGSGNQGFLDQIAALKWVEENIREFGGDPGNVTLFGESAGAWSISVLQASPMARGLFHKVIGESGSRFLPMGYLQKSTRYAPAAESRGKDLARLFSPEKDLDLAGLRTLPATQIMRAYQSDARVLWNLDALAIVDGQVLPEQVYEIFSRGRQADVPVLIGSNENEATTFNPEAMNPKTADSLDYEALTIASVQALLPEVDNRIYPLYPVGHTQQARQSYFAAQTDIQFTQPMSMWAKKMATVNSNAYLYWWNWHPSINGNTSLGAFHAAEIPYVFGTLGKNPAFGFRIDESPQDTQFSNLIMDIWTHFAKTGNPSIEGVIDWPAYTTEKQQYVVLGPRLYTAERLRADQVELISEAYEKRRADR